jgi:hypothetical protein
MVTFSTMTSPALEKIELDKAEGRKAQGARVCDSGGLGGGKGQQGDGSEREDSHGKPMHRELWLTASGGADSCLFRFVSLPFQAVLQKYHN